MRELTQSEKVTKSLIGKKQDKIIKKILKKWSNLKIFKKDKSNITKPTTKSE